MKKSKIGWSLVLIFSTAALIGYGAWSLHFLNRNLDSRAPQNNQGTTNSPFNRGGGQEEQSNENFGGMMNGNNGNNRNYNNGGNNNYGGMMGGNGFQNGTRSLSYLDEKTSDKVMADSLKNATVDKKNNTITFTGKDITIVLVGGPKIADDKFFIGGLINPTIQVPKDAKVYLNLINEDDGMPHGVEITNAPPAYSYMSMMDGGIYPDTFVPILPAATVDKYPTAVTAFNANQEGTFYYICQYPGHAANGMYGKFIIK
jgi:rusticyanin